MEELHQSVETYIATNMDLTTHKYSLNKRDARDYSLPDAPLLSEGVDPFVIFDTQISGTVPVTVGGTARRQVGVTRIEIHTPLESTTRNMLKILNDITPFLVSKSNDGVIYRNITGSGDYTEGDWRVDAWTVDFQKTKTYF